MADKKLLFLKGNGSGEVQEDPDNYKKHFPNLEFTEKAKKLPTYSQKEA